MRTHAGPPDDTLREFLLGTLSADGADEVQRWLDSDPANAAWLAQLLARDPLTDAVNACSADAPVSADAVERVVRGVSDSRHPRVPVDADTPARDDRTVRRSLPTGGSAWPPERLGQFRILRELGHGGMGYVFEAEDEKLDRRVAVKVLAPELARRPVAATRFLREARAAAKVDHENVVPVLHVGEDRPAGSTADGTGREDGAGTPFMVMPLLRGESLSDRLKRCEPMSIAEALRVGRDVAAGLAAAHAMGLVHRDLKPGNVWLDAGTGRARVLDFGLARHDDGSDAVTQSGALTGTPAYMAPELLDGRPATVRSDLFALGAVLYECATGKRAFEGPTVTAILKAVTDHEPPAPVAVNPGVPAALSALVVRLLAKNPADRPASAPEVATALAGAPTATWHPDAPPPVDRVRPARQIRLGCVITISLCLLIGIGAAALLERESGRRAERAAAERRTAAEQARQEAERLAAEARRAALSSPSPPPGPSVRYRGRVDVKLARTKDDPLMRLNVAGALPMRPKDVFTIEGEVNPPAYLYLVWVDPGHDVTPVYPWDAAKGWGSRPAKEEPRSALRLPADVSKRYTAPTGRPGVATMVLFACEKPLAVPDAEIEGWFKDLPELPLPGGREDGAMWFDNYAAADDPLRGTFGEVDADAFGRWQGKLKKALGGRDAFQTAVSFARTGKK